MRLRQKSAWLAVALCLGLLRLAVTGVCNASLVQDKVAESVPRLDSVNPTVYMDLAPCAGLQVDSGQKMLEFLRESVKTAGPSLSAAAPGVQALLGGILCMMTGRLQSARDRIALPDGPKLFPSEPEWWQLTGALLVAFALGLFAALRCNSAPRPLTLRPAPTLEELLFTQSQVPVPDTPRLASSAQTAEDARTNVPKAQSYQICGQKSSSAPCWDDHRNVRRASFALVWEKKEQPDSPYPSNVMQTSSPATKQASRAAWSCDLEPQSPLFTDSSMEDLEVSATDATEEPPSPLFSDSSDDEADECLRRQTARKSFPLSRNEKQLRLHELMDQERVSAMQENRSLKRTLKGSPLHSAR